MNRKLDLRALEKGSMLLWDAFYCFSRLGCVFLIKRTSKEQIVSCWKEDGAEQLRAKSLRCEQQSSVLKDKGSRDPWGNTSVSSIRWYFFIYRLRVNKTLDCLRFMLSYSNVVLWSKKNHTFVSRLMFTDPIMVSLLSGSSGEPEVLHSQAKCGKCYSHCLG